MAAAVLLLLLILFTEVLLGPVTGIRVSSIGKNGGPSSSNNNNNQESSSARLSLEIRPRGSPLVLGRRGVTLTCAAGGPALGPRLEILWLYNGEPILLENNNNNNNNNKKNNHKKKQNIPQVAANCGPAKCNLLPNGSLRLYKKKNSIVQKRKGREGNGTLSSASGWTNNERHEYRCIAKTSYGASIRSAPTDVLYAELDHAFQESPKDLVVQEGEVSRLSCSIDSVPFPPNISWIHDGEIIPTDLKKTKFTYISPGVLYIRATELSDAGSYRCVATNEFLNVTKKSKEAKLTVISKLESEKSQNPITLFPQTSYKHSPLNGTNLRLACAASGYPTPTTSWTFVPQSADTKATQHRLLLNSSLGLAILELKKVSVSDAGTYICSINNTFNNDSAVTQIVTVEVLVPPSFIKKPLNQICPNGRTARFECQAQGFPTPRIYWLRNSTDITIDGRRTVYVKDFNKMELAISATVPSDSGIYQCVAVNSAGEVWAAGRLQVNTSRNSPAAPTSLTCEARSPVKMFISWEPPKFLPFSNITAYTVHYGPVDGGKEEVSPPEPGNSTSVEVTKLLEPFTNYTFYVRLWNNHGASDQSSTIICSTDESVPKTAPKISVSVISSTKLNITWKPLTRKEAQGIVTEYKLEWRLFQHPSAHVRTLPFEVEQYVLSDLIPGEKYDLRVLARTKQGWPNISESELDWVTVTMPSSNDFIQAQTFILNSTSIKIKWSLKTDSYRQITSWSLLGKTDEGNIVASVNFTSDILEYSFANLETNTSYTFELCALSFNESVYCTNKRVDLKRISTSNIPSSLEAIPISSTSINLTWMTGKSQTANLFEVCFVPVHTLKESYTCNITNSTRVKISNLRPFMLYQFKVRALSNDSDDNPFSETIECYTNEDVPGKVEKVEWFLTNSTEVRVVWKEPKNSNGVIQNYFIIYTTDNIELKSAWHNVTVFGNKTSANLSDLVSGKRYIIIIQAMTKAGLGMPSDPIIISTGSSGNSAEIHGSFDEHKPVPKLREDKKLGIILGIGISMCCIVLCLCSMYCRKKYESLRSLRESAQPLKNRVLTRNGNGCCIDRSSTPVNQPPTIMSNEFELAVLCPPTPISNNPLCDTKGVLPNGIKESGAKEPLLPSWEVNGTRKDLRITENPQYKSRENENMKKLPHQELPDMNSTQLTTLNFDLSDSKESLNNNLGRCATGDLNETLPPKAVPAHVPVLGPNG